MDSKSGVGIVFYSVDIRDRDRSTQRVMEPAGSVKNDARSVKREKMGETYNGSENTYEKQADMRYRCDDCNLTFEGMEYLILHKKFHGNDKDTPMMEPETSDRPVKEGPKKRRKFKCDLCDVKVNSQYHLDIHRSKHEGIESKKFICEVCDRSFVAAQFLKSHMQTHSLTSTINCEICGKSFTGQAYLKLHMQLHNDIKKFKCGKCDEMFPTKNCLKMHMKKHTKVKSFKCEYCNKLFVSKITMEKHRQSHEGQPVDCLVKCTQCDRTMHSTLLRTHMARAHPPNVDDDVKRPFKCSTCGKSFIVKINLNLHIRVCHPDLAEPEEDEEEVMTDNS